jgi:uncharacterized phiE125 gp8 family phage protein
MIYEKDNIPSLAVIEANHGEPVSLAEMRSHLRITSNDEDKDIRSYLMASSEFIEEATGIAFLTASYRQSFRYFQDVELDLLRGPVSEITNITYIDTFGNTQTLATGVYTLSDTVGLRPQIYLNAGQSWPSTNCSPSAIRINFKAGYSSPFAVPFRAQQAIKFLTAHFFENRVPLTQIPGATLPFALQALINQLKTRWV